MAEINWGALQSPDFAGNALRYRRAGEEDGRAIATRNALKSYGTNPDGAIQALMGVDPDAAMQLQDRQRQDQERQRVTQEREARKGVFAGYGTDPAASRQAAMATGDPELIDMVSKMDAEQRKVAADNAEGVASFAYSLKGMTPEARRAQLQNPQNIEFLAKKGLKPEQIAGFDPTDDALDAIIGQGMTVREMLADKREDRVAETEQRRLDEAERRNRVVEGIAGQNADTRRITATRPRAGKASGGGAATTSPALQAIEAALRKRGVL